MKPNREPLRWLLAAAAALALGQPAWADYVWLQREGGQAAARVGELHKPRADLSALRDARAVLPDGKTAAAEAQGGQFAMATAGGGDLRFTAARVGAEGALTYYQARFGRAETKTVNDLELTPTEPGGNTFRLVFKGRPVSASQVNVDTSEGWHRVLKPAADGTVSFTPSFPGLYVLEVTARLNDASVTLDGKQYEDVRYVATLSFEVPR